MQATPTQETMSTISGIAIGATIVGSWLTHILWCISAAHYTGSAIALLIVGLVIPPIGWLHGISIWLGFTWI